jgi:hypothetical protein
LPIEYGGFIARFIGTPREERMCTLCDSNELGDAFHYLLKCPFLEQRENYIANKYYVQPNSCTFANLITFSDHHCQVKLALLCKYVIHVLLWNEGRYRNAETQVWIYISRLQFKYDMKLSRLYFNDILL